VKLAAVLLLGVIVAGCATTRHGIEISNVQNVKGIYIRNAGTASWGANILGENIDKSRYSEMVDIKVVDANDIVYCKYNVPLNDAAFEETGKTSTMNLFAQVVLAGAIVVGILLIF